MTRRIINEQGCWIWTGGYFSDGYGETSYRKRPLRVHRAAMELFNGTPGMIDKTNPIQVLHRCDDSRCFNPDHLFLGTATDNMADRDRKGRQAKGEKNYRTKLVADDVREIRSLYREEGWRYRALAEKFGITVSGLEKIIPGKTWRHIA